MARQRIGQHFLADPGWLEEIARAIRVSPQSISPSTGAQNKDFCWLEIGAGHGEMTEHLASTGAPVYAVELDQSLVAPLQKLTKQFPNLTIISSDILEPTSPSSRPAAAFASTAICPTTSPRPFFIIFSPAPTSSTKST